ncbi:alpha/beta fold hydrolase [Candidatus Uabimicrobium amorphum]|uniref:AB hydrolase-1 domain-containing protein n=1 Tax=Uabimicrobium amorphum TaxID=2596890 RepID=A0A5S9ILN9_UABAM|nr:alpha/beta hydrolase [Candidatus Uabimicrobium amorphum]BBM84169.1 hypothetical protein UABAM_02525 [Candidatus Uabimicrobium amorphum]
MSNLHQAQDGTLVDFQHIKRQNSQGTFFLWPCGMGDIRSHLYQNYCDILKKFDLILYNPRSHGESQGNYCFHQAVQDARYFMQHLKIHPPLYGVGHSAGGAGILRLANSFSFQKLFLFSPILNSRQALEFMYREQTQYLFTKLFCRERSYNPKLWDVLMDGQWLDYDHWNGIKDSIEDKAPFLNSIKKSMEEIAHPGYGVYDEIVKHGSKSLICIPEKDLWFSIENQLQVAKKNNITIATVYNAKNHFFKRRWNNIWKFITYAVNGENV